MKYVQYDIQGNIKAVIKGIRQPIFYGALVVEDNVVTDGMKVDITQYSPTITRMT